WWVVTIASAIITLAAILVWLWRDTAAIPEAAAVDVGLGETLPVYVSGPASVGWWAMFITMVGDGTAFASLVFGYFFYWTIHEDFTAGIAGPGMLWPVTALILFVVAWGLMLLARALTERGPRGAQLALLASLAVTIAASLAGLAGPYVYDMDPTAHVYPAIVWVVSLWTIAHAAVGVIMQLYCLARSLTGRMTGEYDQDIRNVTLYWHFMVFTAIVSFG